jgi:hypothetical protein
MSWRLIAEEGNELEIILVTGQMMRGMILLANKREVQITQPGNNQWTIRQEAIIAWRPVRTDLKNYRAEGREL